MVMNDQLCLLLPQAVSCGIALPSKDAVLAECAHRATQSYGLAGPTVLAALEERERLGSTGFGGGVAIPHARLPGLGSPVGVCLRLTRPIDFASVDERPVDLVFCLLSPEGDGAAHLKALAEISRQLRSDVEVAKLRGATGEAAFFALLSRSMEQDAA